MYFSWEIPFIWPTKAFFVPLTDKNSKFSRKSINKKNVGLNIIPHIFTVSWHRIDQS